MNHQIRQQFLEVEYTGSESEGFELQRKFRDLFHRKLLPSMEKAFDHASPQDHVLSFDKITIDIGFVNFQSLESDLADSVIVEIINSMKTAMQNDAFGLKVQKGLTQYQKTIPQTLADAFLYFLKTGILPWSFRLTDGETLESELLDAINNRWDDKDKNYFTFKLVAAISDRNSLNRFANQFSYSFREISLKLMLNEQGTLAERSYSSEETTAMNTDELFDFYKILFNGPLLNKTGTINPESQSISNNPNGDETKGVPSGILGEGDGIYIENAGLVLLHPFLSRYFSALSVISGNEMLHPGRAMLLLHHLATGQAKVVEYNLALPKILCGLSLNSQVLTEEDISEKEFGESKALLTSVIMHWSALKNTSPDALRGTFLTRPGKLYRDESDNWILQVESRSFDILLEQLPWSISIIRLPWMEQVLTVEWDS